MCPFQAAGCSDDGAARSHKTLFKEQSINRVENTSAASDMPATTLVSTSLNSVLRTNSTGAGSNYDYIIYIVNVRHSKKVNT